MEEDEKEEILNRINELENKIDEIEISNIDAENIKIDIETTTQDAINTINDLLDKAKLNDAIYVSKTLTEEYRNKEKELGKWIFGESIVIFFITCGVSVALYYMAYKNKMSFANYFIVMPVMISLIFYYIFRIRARIKQREYLLHKTNILHTSMLLQPMMAQASKEYQADRLQELFNEIMNDKLLSNKSKTDKLPLKELITAVIEFLKNKKP